MAKHPRRLTGEMLLRLSIVVRHAELKESNETRPAKPDGSRKCGFAWRLTLVPPAQSVLGKQFLAGTDQITQLREDTLPRHHLWLHDRFGHDEIPCVELA
jgi:hypothetical protein